MKIFYSALIAIAMTAITSCDLFSDDDSTNNSAKTEQMYAQRDLVEELRNQRDTLLISDPDCISSECTTIKNQLVTEHEKLENLVESASFAYSFSEKSSFEIVSQTGNSITYKRTSYECSDSTLITGEYENTAQFEVNNGTMTWDRRDCDYSVFNGTSSTLIGTWHYTHDQPKLNGPDYCSDYSDDYISTSPVQEDQYFTFTTDTFEYKKSYKYNCYIDDFHSNLKKDSTFKKIDCNTYSIVYANMKETRSRSIGSEIATKTTTSSYKNHSCTKVRSYNLDTSTPPDCKAKNAQRIQFNECYKVLLEEYCLDHPEDEELYCQDFCDEDPTASFCDS